MNRFTKGTGLFVRIEAASATRWVVTSWSTGVSFAATT